MSKHRKIYLSLTFLVVFLISLIPVVHISSLTGSSWKGIVPEYIEDSSYYYARLNDIERGHPLIGNPYFIEHKDSISPAFFVSDWLASVPLVLGLPFNIATVFNIIFWSEVFVLVLYFLFSALGCGEKESFVFSLVTYLQVFWLFVRPVAMQVVFPAYGLFLLALFLWLKDKESKKKKWFLVGASLYSIYVYTYLLQIVFFTVAIVFVQFLIFKKWQDLKKLSKILFIIFICSIPFLIVSYFQIFNTLYPETIYRIGLLSTYIPRMDFIYYGRWIIIIFLLLFLSEKWIYFFKSEEKALSSFIFITGLGLLLASGSNIVTGKELELSNHIGRFIIWWFPVVFFAYASVIYRDYRKDVLSLSVYKKLCLSILVLICIFAMIRNIPRAFPFFRVDQSRVVSIQKYASPLVWLEENIPRATVVWSDDAFSNYVPIYTKHYVLFHHSGALQLVSDKELEDRYLVSSFISGGATREDIEKEVGFYGGAGKVLKTNEMQEHFDYMYERYKNTIEPNINKFLLDYMVGYIVIRKDDTVGVLQVKKLYTTLVYEDGNFFIYKLSYTKI